MTFHKTIEQNENIYVNAEFIENTLNALNLSSFENHYLKNKDDVMTGEKLNQNKNMCSNEFKSTFTLKLGKNIPPDQSKCDNSNVLKVNSSKTENNPNFPYDKSENSELDYQSENYNSEDHFKSSFAKSLIDSMRTESSESSLTSSKYSSMHYQASIANNEKFGHENSVQQLSKNDWKELKATVFCLAENISKKDDEISSMKMELYKLKSECSKMSSKEERPSQKTNYLTHNKGSNRRLNRISSPTAFSWNSESQPASLCSSLAESDTWELQQQVISLNSQLEQANLSKQAYESATKQLVHFLQTINSTLTSLNYTGVVRNPEKVSNLNEGFRNNSLNSFETSNSNDSFKNNLQNGFETDCLNENRNKIDSFKHFQAIKRNSEIDHSSCKSLKRKHNFECSSYVNLDGKICKPVSKHNLSSVQNLQDISFSTDGTISPINNSSVNLNSLHSSNSILVNSLNKNLISCDHNSQSKHFCDYYPESTGSCDRNPESKHFSLQIGHHKNISEETSQNKSVNFCRNLCNFCHDVNAHNNMEVSSLKKNKKRSKFNENSISKSCIDLNCKVKSENFKNKSRTFQNDGNIHKNTQNHKDIRRNTQKSAQSFEKNQEFKLYKEKFRRKENVDKVSRSESFQILPSKAEQCARSTLNRAASSYCVASITDSKKTSKHGCENSHQKTSKPSFLSLKTRTLVSSLWSLFKVEDKHADASTLAKKSEIKKRKSEKSKTKLSRVISSPVLNQNLYSSPPNRPNSPDHYYSCIDESHDPDSISTTILENQVGKSISNLCSHDRKSTSHLRLQEGKGLISLDGRGTPDLHKQNVNCSQEEKYTFDIDSQCERSTFAESESEDEKRCTLIRNSKYGTIISEKNSQDERSTPECTGTEIEPSSKSINICSQDSEKTEYVNNKNDLLESCTLVELEFKNKNSNVEDKKEKFGKISAVGDELRSKNSSIEDKGEKFGTISAVGDESKDKNSSVKDKENKFGKNCELGDESKGTIHNLGDKGVKFGKISAVGDESDVTIEDITLNYVRNESLNDTETLQNKKRKKKIFSLSKRKSKSHGSLFYVSYDNDDLDTNKINLEEVCESSEQNIEIKSQKTREIEQNVKQEEVEFHTANQIKQNREVETLNISKIVQSRELPQKSGKTGPQETGNIKMVKHLESEAGRVFEGKTKIALDNSAAAEDLESSKTVLNRENSSKFYVRNPESETCEKENVNPFPAFINLKTFNQQNFLINSNSLVNGSLNENSLMNSPLNQNSLACSSLNEKSLIDNDLNEKTLSAHLNEKCLIDNLNKKCLSDNLNEKVLVDYNVTDNSFIENMSGPQELSLGLAITDNLEKMGTPGDENPHSNNRDCKVKKCDSKVLSCSKLSNKFLNGKKDKASDKIKLDKKEKVSEKVASNEKNSKNETTVSSSKCEENSKYSKFSFFNTLSRLYSKKRRGSVSTADSSESVESVNSQSPQTAASPTTFLRTDEASDVNLVYSSAGSPRLNERRSRECLGDSFNINSPRLGLKPNYTAPKPRTKFDKENHIRDIFELESAKLDNIKPNDTVPRAKLMKPNDTVPRAKPRKVWYPITAPLENTPNSELKCSSNINLKCPEPKIAEDFNLEAKNVNSNCPEFKTISNFNFKPKNGNFSTCDSAIKSGDRKNSVDSRISFKSLVSVLEIQQNDTNEIKDIENKENETNDIEKDRNGTKISERLDLVQKNSSINEIEALLGEENSAENESQNDNFSENLPKSELSPSKNKSETLKNQNIALDFSRANYSSSENELETFEKENTTSTRENYSSESRGKDEKMRPGRCISSGMIGVGIRRNENENNKSHLHSNELHFHSNESHFHSNKSHFHSSTALCSTCTKLYFKTIGALAHSQKCNFPPVRPKINLFNNILALSSSSCKPETLTRSHSVSSLSNLILSNQFPNFLKNVKNKNCDNQNFGNAEKLSIYKVQNNFITRSLDALDFNVFCSSNFYSKSNFRNLDIIDSRTNFKNKNLDICSKPNFKNKNLDIIYPKVNFKNKNLDTVCSKIIHDNTNSELDTNDFSILRENKNADFKSKDPGNSLNFKGKSSKNSFNFKKKTYLSKNKMPKRHYLSFRQLDTEKPWHLYSSWNLRNGINNNNDNNNNRNKLLYFMWKVDRSSFRDSRYRLFFV